MTYVLAFFEINYTMSWHIVCHHMPSNEEFKFFKKFYGIENLRLTSDTKLALESSEEQIPFILNDEVE